jgi:hypothetical protein
MPTQKELLQARLSNQVSIQDTNNIWLHCDNILQARENGHDVSLALGYVQSGKTTAMSALTALAADQGYKLVIAILGNTLLLQGQNRSRLEEYLGVDERNYFWQSIPEIKTGATSGLITDSLARNRTVLITLIKNASVIRKLASELSKVNLQNVKVLVIDDEADQASLNTKPNSERDSATYAALGEVRRSVGFHYYVQYTATPYAPLLIGPDDALAPSYVEFLTPGEGYTGGREFFIKNRKRVVRIIPDVDEQKSTKLLDVLPQSLEHAITNFIAGAGLLYNQIEGSAPVSMLVHSSYKNDVQARYHFLIDAYVRKMASTEDLENSYFGKLLSAEREKLLAVGVPDTSDERFWELTQYVLKELTIWLINSSSDVQKVKWNQTPFHLLIGGNKLDRGFTVEGLTVTYMNRPASDQIDTLEQRARAFGYRSNLLPYCQFFATLKTLKMLTGIVHTEDDLRSQLRDYLEQGRSVSEWVHDIGLLLPSGALATRKNVAPGLDYFNPEGDWNFTRKPTLLPNETIFNRGLLDVLGLFDAPRQDFGRLSFRTVTVPISEIHSLIQSWKTDPGTPGWHGDRIEDILKRFPDRNLPAHIVLLDNAENGGKARLRSWAEDTGYVNLFQGRDNNYTKGSGLYPGDREMADQVFGESAVVLQVHLVAPKQSPSMETLALAIKLMHHSTVRRRAQ